MDRPKGTWDGPTRERTDATPRLLFSLMALAFLLAPAGCLYRAPWTDDAYTAQAPPDLPPLPRGSALRVLVLGDFGTGEAGQKEVSRNVAATHAAAPPHLVLTVGDNFYPKGVQSVEDPLWATVFEEVYAGEFWDRLVFFPALGNHDVDGDVRAQIDYSEASPRWTMPGNYYTFRRALPSGDTVRFLALDTNRIHGEEEDAARQLAWVEEVLEESGDRWVVAYGHHPMVSGGWHGPSSRVREALAPRFRGRVPLYLAGHSHSTELLRTNDGIIQGVCGGGGGRDNAYRVGTTTATLSAFSNGGWCFLHVFPDTLVVEGYNRAGTIRFRHLIPAPGTDFEAGRGPS